MSNYVKLFLGDVHAARVVRALTVAGDSAGFNELKAALTDDLGPTPAPSVLTRTLGRLIAANIVVKNEQGRYLVPTPDAKVTQIVDLACELELEAKWCGPTEH